MVIEEKEHGLNRAYKNFVWAKAKCYHFGSDNTMRSRVVSQDYLLLPVSDIAVIVSAMQLSRAARCDALAA